ncbi:hypothetical protein G9A89_010064 [Geosiphon pyriformis]|nr:hypothetical protein G9A89_010064 [Geosiphon pyriformis]
MSAIILLGISIFSGHIVIKVVVLYEYMKKTNRLYIMKPCPQRRMGIVTSLPINPKHTSYVTHDDLQAKILCRVPPWSSHTPDLNPIET